MEEDPTLFAKSKETPESTLDVYAKPYVPQSLRSVNDAPAQAIPCVSYVLDRQSPH